MSAMAENKALTVVILEDHPMMRAAMEGAFEHAGIKVLASTALSRP